MLRYLLLIYCVYVINLYSFGLSEEFIGKRTYGTSNVIAVFANHGFQMCLRKCSSYVDCEAVNYKQPHLHCELLKDTRTIKLVDDIDFIHALKSNCIVSTKLLYSPVGKKSAEEHL